MSYKTKKVLSDKNGQPILQYYNKEDNKFKVQNEVANEKTLKKIIGLLSSNDSVSSTKPVIMKNFKVTEPSEPRMVYVHWFHDGFFYGAHGNIVYTSPDGIDWVEKTRIPDQTKSIKFLLVSDTNRIIAKCANTIHVSDESQVFTDVPIVETGNFREYGHTKNGNVIGLTTYVSPQGTTDGQLHEAFLSTDHGATFSKILDTQTIVNIEGIANTESTHIHDIEYDNYSGRLFIWLGDMASVTMIYSDDWGSSWRMAFPQASVGNHTQMISTQRGLALGADTGGGGIGYVHIDRSKRMNPPITIDNYEGDFWKFDDQVNRYIAQQKWIDRENGIYLMPFIVEYDDNAKRSAYIAYSRDGYNWHNLFKAPFKGHYTGFYSAIYGNGKLVGSLVGKGPDGTDRRAVYSADLTI